MRTSVLSKRWQFLWKSVPVSLVYECYDDGGGGIDFVNYINRELHYWRSFHKIRKFTLYLDIHGKRFAKDVDLWVYFATKLANVEHFELEFTQEEYEFPQFAYENTSLRNLVLRNCTLNPSGSVNWTSLVSLSIGSVNLTESVMEKVLSGCLNLECLKLDVFSGIHRLEISNVKLRKLTIQGSYNKKHDLWLEILAPYIQHLEFLGSCCEIRMQQRNVHSLVTAVLNLVDFDDGEYTLEKQCSNVLQSVAHVENLELSTWCIGCLSILELKGWQPPPSSRKFLKLNAALKQLDFPGICSFLQSSSDLETLVMDWSRDELRDRPLSYTNEDEQSRTFETHNFACLFPHLKIIKILNFYGPSEVKCVLPLIKYLLKHATVLEKFVIAARWQRSDVSRGYVKMEQELLNFPRSSPHASVIFSY